MAEREWTRRHSPQHRQANDPNRHQPAESCRGSPIIGLFLLSDLERTIPSAEERHHLLQAGDARIFRRLQAHHAACSSYSDRPRPEELLAEPDSVLAQFLLSAASPSSWGGEVALQVGPADLAGLDGRMTIGAPVITGVDRLRGVPAASWRDSRGGRARWPAPRGVG